MTEVVYLTGAPASGKSSLTKALASIVPELRVFEYGAELTKFVSQKGAIETQDELRTKSSIVVTPADVDAVDRLLMEFVATNRQRSPIIIDSHAVTKEGYGFRVTPFSLEAFAKLRPTQIWMLYASPEVTRSRIARAPGGRPQISEEEARFHTQLQASVAATYAMQLGIPLHAFDSVGAPEELAANLAARLRS